MNNIIIRTILPVMVLFVLSCSGPNKEKGVRRAPGETQSQMIADQIIYDVMIKNHDPEDDWTEKCLAGLNREELIDFILNGLYKDRFKAYDIFNDKSIPSRKIKKMEEDGEFTREQISKIQFVEQWYIDTALSTLTKRVTEVRLGIEHFDNYGMLIGHNPLFKVKFIPYPLQ